MSYDLQIAETLNGGDLRLKGNDLSAILGFQNMPYLALFGGNLESDTPVKRLPTEQDFSFWGNALFHPQQPAAQFNSRTERTLKQTPLTSAGRLIIEEAIKKDLEFMKAFAVVTVNTAIIATNNLRINIGIREPDNLQAREFIFIWDATRGEVQIQDAPPYTPNTIPTDEEALQYELGFML